MAQDVVVVMTVMTVMMLMVVVVVVVVVFPFTSVDSANAQAVFEGAQRSVVGGGRGRPFSWSVRPSIHLVHSSIHSVHYWYHGSGGKTITTEEEKGRRRFDARWCVFFI